MKVTIFLRLSEGWALGYDPLQWILMKRIKDCGRGEWALIAFVASFKRVLLRVLDENNVRVTPESRVALKRLPDSFREWLAQRDSNQDQGPQEVKFRTPRPPENDTGEAAA